VAEAKKQKPPNLGPTEENPRSWVEYLQQMLNWFYQMQVVTQDGVFGNQTMHAVTHLRGQLHLSEEPVVDEELWKQLEGTSGGGVGDPVDVTVELVPGDGETSWAASIAMVASANSNAQTLESVLAKSPQRQRTATEARQIATEHFGFAPQDCEASEEESWAGVLRAHGALWVQVPDDEYHVFVVAGIKTEDDVVKIHVLDPRTGHNEWPEFAKFREAYHLNEGVGIQVLAGH
jgi:hypothetical protein